jgi:hypothetical protein
MIKRILKLRAQINLFCSYTYKADFNDEMRLNEDDWHVLTHLTSTLIYFKNATIALQGQTVNSEFSTMGECIPIIKVLSLELTELQTWFLTNSTFKITEINDLPDLSDINTFLPWTGNNPASGFILECTNRAHVKLSQYYGLTDELVWFTVGMILNPTIK